MRALTCAFLSLGLILATCAGCGDTGTTTKKPTDSKTPNAPAPGAGQGASQIESVAPTTPTETPPAEEKKEGAEAKPAEEKPAEEKKSDEKNPEGEKKSDEKPEEK
jgi:hypothetical protein